MRKWIVQLQSDDSVHVISSNKTPKNPNYKRVLLAPGDPDPDEGSTFNVLEVDVGGQMVWQAVQDADRKANRLAARQAEEDARDAEKADRQAKRDKVKGLKLSDLNNDAKVKQAILDILAHLGLE